MKRLLSIFLSLVVLLSCFSIFASAESLPVEVLAKSALLMEVSSKRVLLEKNSKERLYPASITKIMSLLLVCEAIDSGRLSLDERVSVSSFAASRGGSQIWLEPGEEMTVRDLLKATAVYSANDACTQLGECVAGSDSAFVARMNERAAELGMKDTHFENCTGLDDTVQNHMTTAYDIALMSCELLKHRWITDYTTIWMDSLRNGRTELVNTNRLVRTYRGVTGLKTGTTSRAGCCVSASARRDSMELVAVVLGSDNSKDRFAAAANLLDWGFANYELYVPEIKEGAIKSVKVLRGEREEVYPLIPSLEPILLSKGEAKSIKLNIEQGEDLEAPVEKGQIIGKITVLQGARTLAEYDLKAEAQVKRVSLRFIFLKIIGSVGINAAKKPEQGS